MRVLTCSSIFRAHTLGGLADAMSLVTQSGTCVSPSQLCQIEPSSFSTAEKQQMLASFSSGAAQQVPLLSRHQVGCWQLMT